MRPTLFQCFFLATLILRSQTPPPDLAVNAPAQTGGLNPGLPTLFIAGDSTAARNNGNPVQGWGVPFAGFFDPGKINVANRARGGRSSRTFITEGLWDHLLAEVKAGDFVLIQFGHNDGGALNEEPPGSTRPLRARGSLPGIGDETREIDNVLTKRHEVVHTYGWYLRKMIADVRAKGATPFVLSLTVRDYWKDGKIERASGSFRTWARQVAAQANVAFIDVTRLMADHYQELGPAASHPRFTPGHTHPNVLGAEDHSRGVVAGLKGLRPSPFMPFLSALGQAVAPDPIGWLNLPEPADPRLPSIILVGDSTVRNGRGDGALGQWGWGDSLGQHFDPAKVNVVNRAIGGLSSRTFLTQGHWARALTLVKPGDYVLIQFGTNDSSPVNDDQRARGTLHGVGEETQAITNLLTKQPETVHTYGWYLRQMIRDTRAAGGKPVVCTLVPRKIWRDGHLVRAADTWAGWAKAVAAQEGAPCLDLNELVARRYEELGPDRLDPLFGDKDLHTSKAGADLTAGIVATELGKIMGAP